MACGFGNPRHGRLGSLRYFGCGSAAQRCIAELHSAACWQVPVRSSFPTLYRLQIGDTEITNLRYEARLHARLIHPAAAYPNAEMLRFLFQRAQLIVPSPTVLAVLLTGDINRVSPYAQPYLCNQRKIRPHPGPLPQGPQGEGETPSDSLHVARHGFSRRHRAICF